MARIDYSFPFDYLNDEQKLSITDRKVELNSWLLYHRGAIIGYVEFTESIINHPSIWAEPTPLYKNCMNPRKFKEMTGIKPIYNWVVSESVLFDKPIENVKGKLSFWDCEEYLCVPDHISADQPLSEATINALQKVVREAYKIK